MKGKVGKEKGAKGRKSKNEKASGIRRGKRELVGSKVRTKQLKVG